MEPDGSIYMKAEKERGEITTIVTSLSTGFIALS